jgi:nucleoside-diphosphate-sugar epimerase
MRILFIGGTGEISFACAALAKQAGHEVSIFNRGLRLGADDLGATQVVGDFNDNDSYARLADHQFDVVCQFLAYNETAVDRDIATFSGRCGQYIFISSASAYQKPCPYPVIREDTPLGNPFWAYSREKAACESRLLAAHDQGKLPVTIIRPSHTYRTRVPSIVIQGDHLAWRLLNGKPIIIPGDGESVWTLTHSDDFARAFVQTFGNPRSLGECIHITEEFGHTWNQIIRTVARTLGVDADICHILSKALVAYEPAWTGPLLGDKSNSMIFDTQKIKNLTGGWQCEIPLDQGVARAWTFAAQRLAVGYIPDPALDGLIDRIIADEG